MSTPAFQFYAKDFLSATQSWSIEEVGIYIRLLCNQWDTGGLPNDQLRLSRIAGTDIETFKKAWVFLGFKFIVDKDGLLKNSRLEETRLVQDAFREKQRLNAVKGGRPKKTIPNKTQSNSQTKPKQNPTVKPNHIPNKTSSSSYIEDSKYVFFDDKFSALFDDFKDMRKSIKKPLTERATKSILDKISKLWKEDKSIAFEMVDRSIRNSWADVYEIKEDNVKPIRNYNKVVNDGRPVN
jgi:uncharacterized protein YdaU (DUF1376 family)